MARGKSKNPKTFEKILMVLVNGGVITKEQIEATIGYKHMYRISTELWKIKTRGGVIKTVKDGRKTVGYELNNVKEMMKYLSDRGFSSTQISDTPVASTVSAPKVKKTKEKVAKLSDLNAEKSVEELEIVEVTNTETTSSAFEPALL
jgi:hypothetical protein